MNIIKTEHYKEQVEKLSKKYKRIHDDLYKFELFIDEKPFSNLGADIFKYRVGNSSIPVGKRGGFRIIAKKTEKTFLPILIYSKTDRENVNDKEIIHGLEIALNQYKETKKNK